MISYNYKTKIFYRDIDQMGIVYYSRYFEFFEAARTELLSSIDLNVTEIESLGVYLPVVSTECTYINGANFEDNLLIQTEIKEIPRLKLVIHYMASKMDTGNPVVEGSTTHVFIKKSTRKPIRPPKEFLTKLKQHFQ